ncbi:phosphatase PAP2 family protein [Sutcliffiella horikoshii]|uniref:phosphatase PAP2 family protein n=1 Tax=Sutcliffiella horikoshii TaxID=79883 RepID=UPI001F182050|nr:phosphatase PAP2 family protein [Sutcliffiella horikoshii]MCG1020197.1 phosphatase PAP2 family protein [Sutcliffiella horikoshii]
MNLKEEARYWKEQIDINKIWAPGLLILTGVGLMITATVVFFELAEDVWEQEKFKFDSVIMDYLQSVESTTLTNVFKMITETGSVWWITAASIFTVLFLWLRKRDVLGVLFFVLAIAGGGSFIFVLKYFFQRERPSLAPEYDGNGYSFPSGHALGSFILYGFIIYLIGREKRFFKVRMLAIALLSLLIISVGLSRVYLQVHFPSDILAGYAVGLIWLICCIFSMEMMKVYRDKDKRAYLSDLIHHRK